MQSLAEHPHRLSTECLLLAHLPVRQLQQGLDVSRVWDDIHLLHALQMWSAQTDTGRACRTVPPSGAAEREQTKRSVSRWTLTLNYGIGISKDIFLPGGNDTLE